MSALKTLSRHAAFGGIVGFYEHESLTTRCTMRFAVYEPPQAATRSVPVVYYLAGLTCTEETFMIKAGAQRVAAELGLMLVAPDTSPRVRLPGDDSAWDFGIAAGFYVDARLEPWAQHYRMYTYVVDELPRVIGTNFAAAEQRQSIMGHSMGGHGALTIALRNPERYRSVSAFAPICAPSQCPWGVKAFTGYLGDERAVWQQYDATELVANRRFPATIRIDQGTADKFLAEQLHPERFVAAARAAGQPVEYHARGGYDHGYYFIQSFVAEHLVLHARALS
jgi:S-formylglutathione hydrolase